MGFQYKSLEQHLDEFRRKYEAAANRIVNMAAEQSEDGTYEIDYDDLTDEYDVPLDYHLIADMLCERQEIIEAYPHGYAIEMKLDPQFCERMNADIESIPDSHLNSYCAVDLIASYEKLLPVKEQDRVTYYFGDYGGHFRKHGVTDEQFREAYADALQAINMSSEAYHERKFIYRGEVETYMRCCMAARVLVPDEEIVYVPPAPTGSDGQWQYEAGRIIEINTAKKNCVVSFEDGEATIPLRYVLARFRDDDYDGSAFGFEHAEPMFGLAESWADHFMWEVKQEYEKQYPDENESPDEDEEQGMTMQ